MSDQRHDPTPWSAAPPASAGWAPYEEPREGAEAGAPSGHTQFPPAAGQGDDGYGGPETQLGMALHEESAAAQQTSYLPPVTDAGPYGGGYGGSYGGEGQPGGSGGGPAGAGGPGTPYGGGQGPAGTGHPGGPGTGYGEGSYGGGQGSSPGGQAGGPGPGYGGGRPSADTARPSAHSAPYGGHGHEQPGGSGAPYGGGSLGGGTAAGGGPQAYAPGGGGPGTGYPSPAGSDGRGAAAPRGPGAVEETAYLPPVTDDGPPGYGGTGAGAAAEQTAYLPPVTGHEPPGGGGAQWPDGWDRGGPASSATGTGHPGAAGHSGAAPGHPGPADVHPDVPSAGRHAHPGAPGQPGRPGADPGFPGPGGPETGTLYGAPTLRRPKPPAEVLREEGTSVLIAPGPQPAALTAVLAGLLAVTAALDVRPGLAVAVALLQVVTAAGWFRLNGMWPAREGIALAAAAGLTATGAVLAVDEDDATIAALGSLGGWFLLICLVQLRSTTAPKERLTALNVALAAATLAVLASGYLAAERHAVVVGAAAVAAGTLGRAVPLPPNASPVAAVAAAGAGGLAAGLGTDMGAAGGLLGLAAGVCVLIAVRVASYDYPSRFVHMTAGVSLPLTLSVPAVHLLGLALL
ncbi:hypothetical protein OG946_15160 [Streptomyces sp. NBC_01808]|uniref:hypothetical protein n=1 Tax=Streptomyces sp. NBC_01808 TaxID=2975947 RepID=UPI002DDAA895|nr:hypothetical protein [Streptomyces sp. NBC_01808]WSA38597.1 hypothetical protein OG946_15160 [Streptomyces sp. NBC_01808]